MMESPMFYKFHTREYLSFGGRVLTISEHHNIEELGVAEPVNDVRANHSLLGEAMTKAIPTELTADIVEDDTARDDCFIAMKYYFLACQKCARPEWREAADLLIERIRHYGWQMNNASYSEQSAQTNNLLNDYENNPLLVGASTTILGNSWINDLRAAQDKFGQSQEVRTQAKARQIKITTEEACKNVRQACELLFRTINALELVSPHENRQALIDELNTVIKEYNTNIKSRLSRLDLSKDEEES
jgi:predicted DNA-binding protein YlxM (UPF0122 family)